METSRGANGIAEQIASLPAMDKKRLVELWGATFPTPPPEKLRKELMVPLLAYRMQESVYGGLSNSARRRLHSLAATRRSARPAKEASPSPQVAKLVRTWGGETHEVFVTDAGFIYRGEMFKKLSPIAKRITGTPWSGPAFFGTRDKDRRNA